MKNSTYSRLGRTLSSAMALVAASAWAGPQIAAPKSAIPEAPHDKVFRFDFEERVRWEIRENTFDFNDALRAATDDNWVLQRFRLGLTVRPSHWLRLYGQVQDSREWLSKRADQPGAFGAEGDDTFDLRQAWLEIGDASHFPLTMKLGRQTLSYGDERLIGAFEWNNIGRTFDAVTLRWKAEHWSLDAFTGSVVVPTRGHYNQSDFLNGNETHRGQVFSGLYFSTPTFGPQITDLYALHFHEKLAGGDTNFFTLGARAKSKPGAFASAPAADGKGTIAPAPKATGFDYDFETAFQTGEVRGLDLTAFAAHVGTGYTFDSEWLPRVGVSYSYGSGDSDPRDGEVGTFQNLFPTNHKFYGQMDAFSWQNMHDLEFSVKLQPAKSVTVKAEFHAFWLANTNDVWYRANGSTAVRPLSPAARAASSYAGSEADISATWTVNKNLQIEGGYSHFFAGQYLGDTGADADADFAYIQAKFTF